MTAEKELLQELEARRVQWEGGGGGDDPTPLFVQLSELEGDGEAEEADGDGAVWREAARWIKYEEDVEAEAGRWGRPHVAALELHALLDLRTTLAAGTTAVLLDATERDLAAASRALAAATGSAAGPLMRALTRPHARLLDDTPRLSLQRVSRSSLQSGDGRRRRSSRLEALGLGEALGAPRYDALLRRIPAGAEVACALVGSVPGLGAPCAALLRLGSAVAMPGLTAVPLPVRFLFVLLEDATASGEVAGTRRRELGRCMGALLSDPAFHAAAYRARHRDDLLEALDDFVQEAIVMPRGDWQRGNLLPLSDLRARSEGLRRRKLSLRPEAAAVSEAPPAAPEKRALLEAEEARPPPPKDDPLSRTGRLFGGVLRDMRRRYPHYLSDFRDGLNGQCLAAAIFMYFAALSSAITFGGLLGEKTHGLIGISETLVFTSVGGVLFALVSGQPLMITGATGPLLLLDESLAAFCRAYEIDFLAARMYAGFWMLFIALVVAALEGSVAVKKITRFTEDIFAFLISLIFISEPITATIAAYRNHPLGADYCANATVAVNSTLAINATQASNTTANINSTVMVEDPFIIPVGPQPNTALWCTMLTLATFTIAYYLRIFRNGKFLGRSARRALGDFGVPIAIVVMVGVAALTPVWTDTLQVPAGLAPTATRPWLVPMAGASVPPLVALAMLLPALMVYIIVFMETHIAELIVDKPERKLSKGSGFHMDVVVMSLVNCVCGLFGAPWQCVATVRSVSHVAALTAMSTRHAPGEAPHVVRVHEQRLTGLVVALAVGASVAGARALRLVPMSVLFGVFLYMGISALATIDLWQRALLLLKPVKHHPNVPYVRRVPTLRMHLFTGVQLAALLLLYVVKVSPISLALPFFLVMMVPLRLALLPRYFTPQQLWALDGAQKDVEDDDEPDFYQEAPLP